MADKEYVNRLENVIKQMLTPLKDIPFNLVIESLTGKKVIPFDFKNSEDTKLLELLKNVAVLGGKEINKNGIESRRPNEVGNYTLQLHKRPRVNRSSRLRTAIELTC